MYKLHVSLIFSRMGKRFKRARKEEDSIFIAIKRNNLKTVKSIINEVGLEFSKLWLGGYALLRTAVNYNQFEIASWLLTKDCKVNRVSDNDESDTPLHLAVLHNNNFFVERLLEKGACITAKNAKGETALHISCRKQNLRITNSLLLNDNTVANIHDRYLTTPLHIAVEMGCLKTVKLLLNHKVNINARTIKPGYEGFTPLHVAIVKKNKAMVNILLETEADIHAPVGFPGFDGAIENDFHTHKSYHNYTPFHLAIEKQDDGIIYLLLHRKANINAKLEHDGLTPLHVAIQNRDRKNVLLLSEHADVHAKTKDGRNMLHIALENDWLYLVADHLFKNMNIDEQTNKGETLLFMAVEMGDEDKVEHLLKSNAKVNLKNIQYQTPLHVASEFSETIVEMLLVHGANVDEINADNETPLTIAVKHCNINIIKEILHYKPSINNIGNKSAFTYAIKYINSNYVPIIQLLLHYGFLWTDENVDADLIHYLISQGELKTLQHLLEHGGNLVAAIKNQSSFVHKAVRNEDVEIIQLLIMHQFDLNILDMYGKSALDYATEINNNDIVDLLLQNGAEIRNSLFPLLFLAKNENIELFQKFLKYTNNVCVSDEFGTTPLHLATWNTDYEFVQLLLDEGAQVNSTDKCSDQYVAKSIDNKIDSYTEELKKQIFTSPLHIAVGKRDADISKMFLECHANVNSRDGYDRTPLHIAAAVKSSDQNLIIKTLFKYGADVNAVDDFKRLAVYYLFNHSCVCSIAFQNQYDLYKECECDFYEEDEVNHVIATFVKHLVLLASMNQAVCAENYNIINKRKFSENLLIECLNEITKMKESKLLDYISYHDILTKKYNSLAALARNEELIHAFETCSYMQEFPLYCDTIKDQFDTAQTRNHLLKKALVSFNNLTGYTLPQAVVESIFDFLLFNDLKMVISAYK